MSKSKQRRYPKAITEAGGHQIAPFTHLPHHYYLNFMVAALQEGRSRVLSSVLSVRTALHGHLTEP